jgi:hypothetical protein
MTVFDDLAAEQPRLKGILDGRVEMLVEHRRFVPSVLAEFLTASICVAE